MAQGDIYSIDIGLMNSSQTVSIANNSIILHAILSFKTYKGRTADPASKSGALDLLDSNGGFMYRFFYERNDDTQDWELHELPIMKKLMLNAGEQLRFIAHSDGPYNYAHLNAKITLMEV